MDDGCRVTECGETSIGQRVRAVTDLCGPQVVVTRKGDETLISSVLPNHREAEVLGRQVVEQGTPVVSDWQEPASTPFELLDRIGKGLANAY